MAFNPDGGPNEIPPAPENGSEAVLFENAIRRFGVENACEWFGWAVDEAFTLGTIAELKTRSYGYEPKPVGDGT